MAPVLRDFYRCPLGDSCLYIGALYIPGTFTVGAVCLTNTGRVHPTVPFNVYPSTPQEQTSFVHLVSLRTAALVRPFVKEGKSYSA